MSGQQDTRYSQSNHQSSSATHAMSDLEQVRSRGMSSSQADGYASDSSRYRQARQPINEAVASAFNTSSAATAGIPPELLTQLTSQITASVMQQLKASNITPTTTNIPQDGSSSTAGSPPIDRATVYTPPSPYRASEEAAQTQVSPTGEAKSSHHTYGRGTPPLDKRPMSPFSSSSHAEDSDAREGKPSRPRGPKRISTGGDATILEKVWGTLFNEQGEATIRLGQFLRGIAVHLIEDYEPAHSLVITPSKLQQYYSDTKVASDIYPWQVIFDDRTSSISRMYREIEAQHHLVQEKLSERPDVPGLTPQGFEIWATLLLRAHPEQEFERLQKTALTMPISNPDDKKERFPKELSRRLFPNDPDHTIATKLQKIMTTHCNVSFAPKQTSNTHSDVRAPSSAPQADAPSLQPTVSRTSAVPEKPESIISPVTSHEYPPPPRPDTDRRAHPYSNPPSESAIEDDDGDDTPTPQPIERERKPYVAAPGGGKDYDSYDKYASTEQRAPTSEHSLGRASSVSERNRPTEYSKHRPAPIAIHQKPAQSVPMDIPETRSHRTSTYHRDQPRSGRNRSPSMSKESGYPRRSETDASYGSYHSVNSNDVSDNARRYQDYEAQRERLAGDRYDAARMAAYDPRERERERDGRPRVQSVAAGFDQKLPYSAGAEEEYYRNMGYPRDGHSYPTSAHYPPNAYRESR